MLIYQYYLTIYQVVLQGKSSSCNVFISRTSWCDRFVDVDSTVKTAFGKWQGVWKCYKPFWKGRLWSGDGYRSLPKPEYCNREVYRICEAPELRTYT